MRSLVFLLLLIMPSWTAVQGQAIEDQQIRAQRLLVRALTHMQTGDTEQALDALETALGFAPGEASILSALADVHRDRGDLPAAIFYAERAVQAAPSETEVHLQTADLLIEAGEVQRASTIIRGLLEVTDWRADVSTRALSFLIDHQLVDVAERLAIDALAAAGPHPALLEAARPLLSSNGAQMRAALQSTLSARQMSDSEVLALLWWSAEADQPELNAWVHEQIVQRHPDVHLPPQRFIAGRTPEEGPPSRVAVESDAIAGDVTAEAVRLEAEVEADPRSVGNWTEAAAAYLRAGLPADALRLAEEASILFPGNEDLAIILARAHLERSDAVRALGVLAPLPDSPLTVALRGLARSLQAGEDEGAADAAEVTLGDWMVAAYSVLAQQQTIDFLPDVERLLSAHGEHVLAVEALGWAQFLRGNSDRAIQLLEQAASVGAPRVRLVERLSHVYQHTGRSAEADRLRATLDSAH